MIFHIPFSVSILQGCMPLLCLWNIPGTQDLTLHFLGNPVAGGPGRHAPEDFHPMKQFPNSILIWTEQLGPLVPVEVQLAAPLSPGRQGECCFATFLLGIRWQSLSMSSGTASPHPGWARSLPWEKGEARAAEHWRTVLSVFSPSLTLPSLCWHRSLRLNRT